MKKMILAALIATTMTVPALAQEPPVSVPIQQKTTLEFDAQQLQWLGMAINEMPKKIADPFLADLQRQVAERQKAIVDAAKAKADAEIKK